MSVGRELVTNFGKRSKDVNCHNLRGCPGVCRKSFNESLMSEKELRCGQNGEGRRKLWIF